MRIGIDGDQAAVRSEILRIGRTALGPPAFIDGGCEVATISKLDAKEQVAIVEKWSAEHPKKQKKTRQDVFLKQYPEANIDEHGILWICPMNISTTHRNSDGLCRYQESLCMDCRREFWMEEVKEDK